jgi:outer membrane protein assembly factor BamB
LFAGSGVDRDSAAYEPAAFCLDARTGHKRWLLPLPRQLPVWGSPVVAGHQVFFGLGNGDILQDDPKPAGALLCVHTRTGKELWRYPLANGVVRKPLVDSRSVYFGCRDGFCYCVNRRTGKLRWKNNLDSPLVASPALFRCPQCGTARLYALGTRGKVRAFDPETGLVLWTFDLGPSTLLASPPVVTVSQTPRGERRRLFFGAALAGASFPAVFCLEEK